MIIVYPGRTKAFFRKKGVADPVGTDVEEIGDAVAPGPVPQDLALQGGLGILGRRYVIDDHLDARRVEHPVFTALLEVHDGRRGGDFMAEDGVQPKDVYIRIRGACPVIVEYFLCDGLAHGCSG
jgi:hypothetical protein